MVKNSLYLKDLIFPQRSLIFICIGIISRKRLAEFKDNPAIFRKYLWLACYHNWFCSTYFSEDGDAEISDVGTTLTFESCFAAKSEVNHNN
jgi:hypothetical protein